MPAPSNAAAIVIGQRARYEELWRTLNRSERSLAQEMLDDVEAELERARRGSWTAAQAAATLVQLSQAVRGLSERQLELLSRALPGVIAQAHGDTSSYLRELDMVYAGSVRPLRWDTIEWLRGYSRPLLRTRLRVYERSFARYGAAAVSDIERAIAKTVTVGTPWPEAREQVWEATRSVVQGRQWMVDRIVRTEVATAYSSTTMAALFEEDEAYDPMLKKLVAIFDSRTGADSKALHGQTKRLRELFVDEVRGKKFDAPPNRPNDREILIGWRKSWGDGASFDRVTREETDEG